MKLFSLTLLISVVCCFISSCDCHNYTVLVLTGPERYAGTKDKVYITLQGSKGNSSQILLNNKMKSEFKRGRADTFKISTQDVGIVTKIRIELNGTGLSKNDNWHLLAVSLNDETRQIGGWFPWNGWLSTSAEEKTMSVEIPESTRAPYTVYKVIVKTGHEKDAGTKGKVYVTLLGETGNSSKLYLDHEGKREFQQDQKDAFFFKIDDIGIVSKIRIELDSAADSQSPNWFLKEVSLQDITRQQDQWFPLNQWLTPTKEQTTISVEISPQLH